MAGRIPQTFINELLARVDIVDVIERRIDLRKKGKNYSACCPFHNEKTPSFSVSPDKQFFYCFGCGISGNALTFLMEYEGQEFVASIEDLAQTMGMEVPRESYSGPNISLHQHLYPLMDKVSAYYQQQLKNPKIAEKAVNYLKNRGLSGEVAKKYGIGYAPNEWQNLLTLKSAADKSDSNNFEQDMIDTGMLIKNDKGHTYDRFRDRIMFPIRNRRGQTIGFGGRIIDQGEPKYLNSPETKLFHKGKELYGLYEMRKELRNIKQILIVEGYMDVVALAQFGIFNATATLGTATSSEHLQTLFRICSRIVFCFDGDKAGKAAAIRAIQNALPLLRDAREVRIMFLPDGEDPDTMVRKIGAETFNNNIDEAATLFDFLLNHLTAQVDMNTFEGPARLVHLAKPFTKEIADPILKTRFDQRLASLAGLSDQQFADAMRTSESATTAQRTPSNKASTNQAIQNITENGNNSNIETVKPIKIQGKAPFRRAIALLLQNPDALPGASIDWIGKLDEPGAIIFSALAQLIEQNESITTGMLIEYWREKPEEKHLKALALKDLIITKQQMPSELADILSRLEKEMIVDQCDLLITKSKTQPLSKEEKNSLNSLLQAMSSRG
ncbi:MAG: DNA primase [Kangiellaceae bacterium]|nr:DNA primase [Kangiellaceae bacterium]